MNTLTPLVDTRTRTTENTIRTLINLMFYPATVGHCPHVVGYIRDEDNRLEVTEALVKEITEEWARDEIEQIEDMSWKVSRSCRDTRYEFINARSERVHYMRARVTYDLRVERVVSPSTGDAGWRVTLVTGRAV